MTIRYSRPTAILGPMLLLAPVAPGVAAELYLPGEIYVGGDQVCFASDLFRAKWWAGADDRPSDVDQVAHPWETPWERLQAAASECNGLDGGNQPPSVQLTADPLSLSGAGQVMLSAAGSTDPDGDPLSYRWQQLAPESIQVGFDSPNAIETAVNLPEPTATTGYVFEVQVSDGELSRSAQVTITQSVPGEIVGLCPSWDADAVYVGMERVTHAGAIWEAQWWTRGEIPGTTGEWGVWRLAPAEALCAGDPDDPKDPAEPGEPADPSDPSDPGDPDQVRLSDLLATEAALTDSLFMESVKASIRTLDNALVERIMPGAVTNPVNVQRVERILSAQDWDAFFPRRAPEYTYTNFLQGIGKFPAFCGDYTDDRDADAICRKALATMFAHFTQETGGHTPAWPEPQWRQGLVYVRELGWSESMANGYGLCDPATWQGEIWPCAVFEPGQPNAGQYKSYFGRGAKQLSYNYNYGPFSAAMFGDVETLLQDPALVADSWLNLASAVFFYVYPQPPKPSMLHALDGTWQPNAHDLAGGLTPGFGVTTQIINGGIECGGSSEHIQSQNRIDYYLAFADALGVPVPADEVLGCANMQRFDSSGAAALSIYWEQDWSQQNACQLVNDQTAFSALTPGDYARCVEYWFDVEIVNDDGA